MSATAPEPDTSLAGALTPRDLKAPVTFKVLADALDGVLSLFTRLRVAARLAEAERRLGELEARPSTGVKYCGTYQAGHRYAAGALVTRSGSLWCATTDTDDVPGEGRTDWLLCVKRGGV
jgi:hypothetical protein